MREKWRFEVRKSFWRTGLKLGKSCWLSNADGYKRGQGCAFDTGEEAEEYLYRVQDEYGLEDSEIQWEGIEPRIRQMELF